MCSLTCYNKYTEIHLGQHPSKIGPNLLIFPTKCQSINLPSMKGMPYLTLDSTVVPLPLLLYVIK